MAHKLLYIETFGCQMNVNDSERIVSMLADLGYAATDDPATSDMILLNTCSVRGGAEEKVYRRLANLRIYKRGGKKQIIAVRSSFCLSFSRILDTTSLLRRAFSSRDARAFTRRGSWVSGAAQRTRLGG